jgi:hypothetical protein
VTASVARKSAVGDAFLKALRNSIESSDPPVKFKLIQMRLKNVGWPSVSVLAVFFLQHKILQEHGL